MKSILVTGAGGGIGTALVSYLIGKGHHVLCQYRSTKDSLADVMTRNDLDFNERCFHADLTDELGVAEMHRSIREKHGPVWAVLNLAGGSSNGMSWKISVNEFKKIVDTNLLSTFVVCREFIPEMREQNGGRIINVSSVVAHMGAVGASHYCAAKAGIEGLSRSLSLELASKNITVNSLALGYYEYGLIDHISQQGQEDIKGKTPLKRFGNASEIGGIVSYLVSDEGAFATGQVFHINGGIHL